MLKLNNNNNGCQMVDVLIGGRDDPLAEWTT